jgi:hypothetical protein
MIYEIQACSVGFFKAASEISGRSTSGWQNQDWDFRQADWLVCDPMYFSGAPVLTNQAII